MKKGGKLRTKRKTPEQIALEVEESTKMWFLFQEHWNLQGDKKSCESCGNRIYGENLSVYHHHLLAKGLDRYKHLKLEISNLMFLCFECHTRVENGFPSQKVIDRTEQAKIKFDVV